MGKNNKVKKNKNKINYAATTEQKEIKSLIIVIIVVVLCVGGVYLLTRAFVTKDLFGSDSTTDEEVTAGTINYDVAIMGQILNRPYDEYYVAIYNSSEGDYISDMATLVYSYKNLDKHLHIYVVDLSNELNADFYDPENVNTKATKVSEMKVGDITLLKIKNGKINKYIVDLDKMKKELGVES